MEEVPFIGNVLKELLEGGGAVIDADAFELGDETISSRELWTAEYQVSIFSGHSMKDRKTTLVWWIRTE